MQRRRNVPSRREPGRSNNQTIVGVLMLIAALMLAATAVVLIIVMMGGSDEDEQSSSMSEIVSSSSQSVPESSSSSSQSESSSSSSAQEVIAPPSSSAAPPPSSSSAPPPVSSSAAPSSSSSSSSSSSASTSPDDQRTVDFDEYGTYDDKETLGNAVISDGDITIENKTIDGSLTISTDVNDITEIVDCVIEGQLVVRGGTTIRIVDSRIGSVMLRSTDGSEIKLVAEGDTRIGKVSLYSNVIFDEQDIDGDSGFSLVEVVEGNPDRSIYLIDTLLTEVEVNEVSQIDIDSRSEIDEITISEPTEITGNGEIGRMYISSDDIESTIEPDRVSKTNDRYDDLDLN